MKLVKLGFNGHLLNAIKSLYSDILCSVKLNTFTTDWFEVTCGLKQGFSLSPMLFNLYINDLALTIDSLGKGVEVDDTRVSVLLYADDIVLIAESEMDLQAMLDTLRAWSKNNLITINVAKSNIVHLRNPSVTRSNFVFKVNDDSL